MSIVPLVTFKAGKCEGETQSSGGNPSKLVCDPTPGYIYLYALEEDEMMHFCWRPRSKPADEPELDLIMFPGDATFTPYTGKEPSEDSENVMSPTDGRIYALKFSSSSQRHLFWLQSKNQHPEGKPNWFSARDLKLGQIVEMWLSGSGEELDAEAEPHTSVERGPDRPDDDDQEMEDAQDTNSIFRTNSTGGAGAGATGGDVRDEGEEAREGGADGGRAASGAAPTENASALVQNFLNSLKGGKGGDGGSASAGAGQNIFTTLGDLLTPDTCIPILSSAPASVVDNLLSYLPPAVILLETRKDDLSGVDVSTKAAEDAIKTLSLEKKRSVLLRVIRSPQLHQSLGSLTVALRDGGLPTVAESLKIKVENGGYLKHGSMPLGGGDAVEAFLDGVERTVKEETKRSEDDTMDTS